ncbi:MAG: hypothetical protein NVV59_03445 [Chitinophagaceae bacterium]|nr:hypothetical protein [Chitinophagaceae bacterium]
MEILIDARGASDIPLPQESNLYSVYLRWALQHPDVNFKWMLQPGEIPPEFANINSLHIPRLPDTFAALQQWYKKELPRIWDVRIPDLFVPVHGLVATHLNVPQMTWMIQSPGRHFLEKRFISRWQYRRKLPAMLKKAKGGWITDNGWMWMEQPSSELDLSCWQMVTPVAVSDIFSKANESALYDIDYQTGGKPFFASFVSGVYPTDTMQLMKSFSFFKKRQQTDWKLLLIGDKGADYAELKRAIESYKYKDDVVLLEATKRDKLIALDLAYALVQAKGQQLPSSLLLMALEQSAAIILAEKTPTADWMGDAPIIAKGTEPADVAESMMLLYKDEELAKERRTGSRQLFNQLTLENQAEKAFANITTTLQV